MLFMSKIIVFNGDSITDAGRDRANTENMGRGFPLLIKAALNFEFPGEYVFHNLGVSGNRMPDMYARLPGKTLGLKPDYLSLLIGVNDIWHGIMGMGNGSVSPEKYEMLFNMYIEEIKSELPDIKIIILEPFVLKGEKTRDCYEVRERWSMFRDGVHAMAEKAARVAEKQGAKFIPLRHLFDEACEKAPVSNWLYDGVHTAPAGHELIKREWLKAFNEIK